MSALKNEKLIILSGFLFATILTLLITPGLDFLAWRFFSPETFWKFAVFVTVDAAFTFYPRLLLEFFIWAVVFGIIDNLSK